MTTYRWTVPQDISKDYELQTGTEFKKQQTTKSGNKEWVWLTKSGADDHLKDADQMALVAGLMDQRIREILWTVADEKKQDNEEETETT